MFKSVEYVGFEGNPDLKAKAEQLAPVLADAVGEKRGEVEVRWSPHPDLRAGVLDMTLSRTLQNGVNGEFTDTFVVDDFADGRDLMWRCLRAWSALLGVLLDEQHKRVEEAFLETAEA